MGGALASSSYYKEVLSVLAAAKRWGHEWKGHKVMVHNTDSMCALGMLNKGTTRNTLVLSTKFNFQIKPKVKLSRVITRSDLEQ